MCGTVSSDLCTTNVQDIEECLPFSDLYAVTSCSLFSYLDVVDRDSHHLWQRAFTVTIFASPAFSPLCFYARFGVQVDESVQIDVSLEDNVAAFAAVSTRRSAPGPESLPSESDCTVAAVPGLYCQFDLVDKLHCSLTKGAYLRRLLLVTRL